MPPGSICSPPPSSVHRQSGQPVLRFPSLSNGGTPSLIPSPARNNFIDCHSKPKPDPTDMKTQKLLQICRVILFYATVTLPAFALRAQEYTFTTLAGPDENPGAIDGAGSAARFAWPRGVAVDGAGNVYVADYLNSTIR